MRKLLRVLAIAIIVLGLPFLVVRFVRTPSSNRAWQPLQRQAPLVSRNGDLVEIRNVRDVFFRTEQDFDIRYQTRTYDLRKLDSVWYVVSRFGSVPGMGHSFLSFGFGDDYVTISVESRREVGENYSPLRGLLREYELLYVIGTESDVIGLRTNIWKESVSLYPVRTSPETMRRVFVDMTARAGRLSTHPEFYNSLTNSCISNIVDHVNDITPDSVPFHVSSILPGLSDRFAYDLGMIDTKLSFEQAREAFRVDLVAQQRPLDGSFSKRIRERFSLAVRPSP